MKPTGHQPKRNKKRAAKRTGTGEALVVSSGEVYDVNGVARAMSVSVNCARRLCRSGQLANVRLSAGYRITGRAILAFCEGIQPIQTNQEPGQ